MGFLLNNSSGKGAVCSAAFNLNPFAAPQYGYCQCQLGTLSAEKKNAFTMLEGWMDDVGNVGYCCSVCV